MQLLHIDSSVLGPHSASRALSAEIVARQIALHPGIEVVSRDLAEDAALHLSSAHLAAWQGGAVANADLGADLAKGGTYLQELLAADIIVIGAPMYNFSIPSQLKAWIDRVVVAGKTFRYGANGAEGLLKNKKVFIASSRGSVYTPGSPAAALEHHESYLIALLHWVDGCDDRASGGTGARTRSKRSGHVAGARKHRSDGGMNTSQPLRGIT